MKEHKTLKGVFEIEKAKNRKLIYTRNLSPGKQVYGEILISDGGIEYREWDPRRSKVGAAIIKNISQIGIKENDVVLYLGAASGTTSSHISDIVGRKGFIFALDFAPRVVRDLVFVCEDRKNITPILADANKPESYMHLVTEVDAIIQDVAQKNQAEIFLKNCKTFLKKGGFGLLALKARSVDVAKDPRRIFEEVRKDLEKEMIVADYRTLDPFEKDHAFFVCKKR